MNPLNKTIQRAGYYGKTSSAGMPLNLSIPVSTVLGIRRWVNSNGNPSYVLLISGNRWLYCVDDFGCENDLGHLPVQRVNRKRDLFTYPVGK